MKYVLAFLLTFSFFAISHAQRTCIKANTLNLRSQPNSSSTIIQPLTRGTEVQVLRKENAKWSYISVAGKEGYVLHQYLRDCNNGNDKITTKSNSSSHNGYKDPHSSNMGKMIRPDENKRVIKSSVITKE